MKKKVLGAMVLCITLSLHGCASTTPTPTAQPTTQTPNQAMTPAPTPTPARTATPEATAIGPEQPAAGGKLEEGTYRAEMSDVAAEADQGWKGYLAVTVSGGDITKAEFDYEKDGKKKSETTAEEYPMTPPPSEWIKTYQDEVVKAGASGEKIDAVSGATRSGRDVNALYEAVLKAAQEGNTKTVTVESDPAQGAS